MPTSHKLRRCRRRRCGCFRDLEGLSPESGVDRCAVAAPRRAGRPAGARRPRERQGRTFAGGVAKGTVVEAWRERGTWLGSRWAVGGPWRGGARGAGMTVYRHTIIQTYAWPESALREQRVEGRSLSTGCRSPARSTLDRPSTNERRETAGFRQVSLCPSRAPAPCTMLSTPATQQARPTTMPRVTLPCVLRVLQRPH